MFIIIRTIIITITIIIIIIINSSLITMISMIILTTIIIVAAEEQRRHAAQCRVDTLGEHKPGRITPGRIKRAALSLQNQNHFCFLIRPRLYASEHRAGRRRQRPAARSGPPFGYLLVTFWLPFGCFWLPFGCLW